MSNIVNIHNVSKIFDGNFKALSNINLDIKEGEIFALLGPNGAGKTTLISAICGLNNITEGNIEVGGFDNQKEYRKARDLIGLVPQELSVDSFETVWATVNFSRGLFGKPHNPEYLEKILKDLTLWDKKNNKMMTLSGGMKRRVMIAKALAHEPRILFLDEPTAGVDVALRKDMWELVRKLQKSGVTIILTTHYIEEAEEMADRIGVISKGNLLVVNEKKSMMKKLGKKELVLEIEANQKLPEIIEEYKYQLSNDILRIQYEAQTNIQELIETLSHAGLKYKSLQTRDSSLEDIFVELVKES